MELYTLLPLLVFYFKFIVEKIRFAGLPLLESVGENEPLIRELRDEMVRAIRKAIIPMKAYAREYEPHVQLMTMDIAQYIK